MKHLTPRSQKGSVSSVRIERNRGFTLVEMLVVLAVLGIGALVVVSNLNGMHRRFELEGFADEISSFIESAPNWAKERNQPVFLIWDPPSALVQIAEDNLGTTVLESFVIPDVMVVRAPHDVKEVYRCDTLSRGFVGTNSQMMAPVTFEITHTTMVQEFVQPNTIYRLTISPLWHVLQERQLLE